MCNIFLYAFVIITCFIVILFLRKVSLCIRRVVNIVVPE